MKNVTNLKFLSLCAALAATIGIGLVTTTPAHSQLSVAKNYVALQPTSPGTAQSGHLNVAGVVGGTQGVFSFGGSSGAALTANASSGTANGLAASGPANGFAGVFQGRVLMDGVVAVSPTMPTGTGAESLFVGDPSSTSFEGMAVVAGATGTPFYSFLAGGSLKSYLEYNTTLDSLRFYVGNQVAAVLKPSGNIGMGTDVPSARLHVSNGTVLATRLAGSGSACFDASFDESIAIPSTNRIGVNAGVGATSLGAQHHIAVAGRAAGGTGSNTGFFAIADNIATANNFAVYGIVPTGATNYAGYFQGNLFATASSSGVKAFRIDHPLDPENMYLEHSSVESDQRMNLYRGRVTTDGAGYATVTVPSWFDALNDNLEYQLTVLDYSDSADFVQAKVVSPLKSGKFRIRTSSPGVQVSWMLTGERIDPVARAHPLEVEREKPASERGKLLFPREYGYGVERSIAPLQEELGKTRRKP